MSKALIQKNKGKGVRYSPTILIFARDLYIQGKTYSEISNEILRIAGRKPTVPMISGWAKRYEWEKEKIETIARALSSGDISNAQLISKDINEQKHAYRQVRTKGIEELIKAGGTTKSLGEASEMIDRAIKGERAIDMGVISIKFIEYIVKVLKEEVDSPEILSKVALRLKSYVVEQIGGTV